MTYRIIQGDCVELMRELPECSIDAIVTDPPYGLEFMGNAWDTFGKDTGNGYSEKPRISDRTESVGGYASKTTGTVNSYQAGRPFQMWCERWARECLRVLKPGGHLLAFGGTRTYHRLASAIEDAGFEVRDQVGWMYGSGFPKSRNGEWGGTALKPAWEPIVVARKPLCGTVEANWREYGTGGLNIDVCRVPTDENLNGGAYATTGSRSVSQSLHAGSGMNVEGKTTGKDFVQPVGRWPANVVHDGSDEVLAAFPDAPGQQGDLTGHSRDRVSKGIYGDLGAARDAIARNDSGSAARFFYCSKASRADRNAGLENPGPQFQHGATLRDIENAERRGNIHPTVKPTALMRWLVRLVTPAGGTVLDPFLGSGSTGRGAVLEGFEFIGMEKDVEHGYVAIAEARIADAVREHAAELAAAAAATAQTDMFNSEAA